MKLNHVRITNWDPPVDRWWKNVRDRPTEPLIEATITMTLSWAEYMNLLGIEPLRENNSCARLDLA